MSSLRFALPAILLVLLLFRIPIFRTMEVASLDLRLKAGTLVRPVPQGRDIVIVGIDDEALTNHGRWPWPRHYWDGIIDTLTDLGAKAIFLDVAFREPAESIVEPHPGSPKVEEVLLGSLGALRRELSVEGLRARFPDSQKDSPVTSHAAATFAQGIDLVEGEVRTVMAPPDSLIGESLRLAHLQGTLVVGLCTVEGEEGLAGISRAEARLRVRRWLIDHPDRKVTDVDPADRRLLENELDALRLFRELYLLVARYPNANFTLRDNLPERPAESAAVSIVTSEGTKMVPLELARYAQSHLNEVRARFVEDRAERAILNLRRPFDAVSLADVKADPLVAPLILPIGRLATTLVDQTLARHHVRARTGAPIPGIENIRELRWGAFVTPSVSSITRELDVVGADNEVKDPDGLLRSTTLFWRVREDIVPAAGLALYLELLRRSCAPEPVQTWIEPGPSLVVRIPVGRKLFRNVRVPLTPGGQCLINWAGSWEGAFDKFSISPVLTYTGIQNERETYLANRFKTPDYAMPLRFGELARELWLTGKNEPISLGALARHVTARHPELPIQEIVFTQASAPHRPASFEETRPPRDWYRFFKALKLAREEQSFKADEFHLSRVAAVKDPVKREARRRLYAKIESAYRRYVIELANLRSALRERVRGRVCFIGNVSSSSTDLAPMALDQNYPKLGSHVNLLNTLLAERFISRPPFLGWSLGGLVDPGGLQLPLLLLVSVVMAVALSHLSSLQGARLAVAFFVAWTSLSFGLLIWGGVWIDLVAPVVAVTVTYLTVYTVRSRRTENIRKMFETYVDPQIVSVLVENEALWTELGGREQVITAFFSDIAGFTTLSELLDPHELSDMLTAYLSPMTEAILHRGGTRDKYIGDAIVAFFGAPLPSPDHPTQSCLASIEQQLLLVELKKKWTRDGEPWYLKILAKGKDLSFRIGLNTGRAKVGNFGSHRSKNYTMIGDTVNLASRLEGANKEYQTSVMASEATVVQARDAIVVRELDRLVVKGKLEAVRVFEVVGKKGEVAQPLVDVLGLYTEGLSLYYARDFDRARGLFLKALAARPDDGPSGVYAKRSELFLAAPPPADWDGTFVMTHK